LPKLLLEIGCEELPASACREAAAQLPELCRAHVGAEPAELYIGPRRLGFLVAELPEQTADQWVQGPPENLREQAAAGFAKKHGVKVDELEMRNGFLGLTRPGREAREVLPEQLDRIVRGLSFSKSMRWDDSGLRFARPVRWVLAKLDDETLLGETSFGHRFTHGAVEIASADLYADALRASDVEPVEEERRRAIVAGLDEIGGWSDPGGKLEEVVYLVEKPLVLAAEFDERFLQLPERVVQTAMQSHQRYFPLGGNRFAFVANGGDPDLVREGNVGVLEGRLDDATFTFERDVAQGIDKLAEQLGTITFAAGAGSFADKAARLQRLAEELGGGEASAEAARLAKADQAAELVREFPDLEGYIGAEYARFAGYPDAVCRAIEEHYLPEAARGPLPGSEPGRVLAVADRTDNLTVNFALGNRPTGSRDPYGLRRAAIGLCRLAVEAGMRIPVRALSSLDHRLLVEQKADVTESPADEVAEFVAERLEGMLEIPVEFLRATRRAGVDDLKTQADLAVALANLPDERLGLLHTAYSRADRLAGKAEEEAAESLRADLLTEVTEKALAEAVAAAEPRIAEALTRLDVEAALAAAEELGPPVDSFFEEVLVMDEDDAVRRNRLRLLLEVRDALGRLGELSQIPR